MGDSVASRPSARPRLTLPLTIFGSVLFPLVMLMIQAPIFIAHLPDSQGGIGWLILLVLAPTVITGVVSGLTAALGAYIGARTATAGNLSTSIGAGVSGALGSALFLIYLSWFYQEGLGLWILVVGWIAVFGAHAGFASVWTSRRRRRVGMPA